MILTATLILNALYAVASLVLALRSFRRKHTRLGGFTIIFSVCLLLAPFIRDVTVARSMVVLMLVGVDSTELLNDLIQGRGPFWAVHFTRLAVSLLIIIGIFAA